MARKLPLWRLISGFGVLGLLLLAGLAVAPVYVANYRFSQYVRALPSQPDLGNTSDEAIRDKVTERAHELGLPVVPGDVTVKHLGQRVQLRIAKYKAQVYRADLHFPEITSR